MDGANMSIGRAFREDRRSGAIALALALALVALQFQGWLAYQWAPGQGGTHVIVAMGVVIVLWRLAGRDFDTLGLRMRIEPSWRYWVVASALIGLAVSGIITGYLLATGDMGDLRFGSPDLDTLLVEVPSACVFAPVFEELVFRVALCSTLLPWIGRWGTVFVSGAIFGLAHFVYSNAGPDNFVAGYFFAWAYLRSGSVAVPIGLHAAGNLVVALLQPQS
jgi:membrane protease YdiL (CAAX protease family)